MTVQFYTTRRSCRTLLINCSTEVEYFEREVHTLIVDGLFFPPRTAKYWLSKSVI